MIRNREVTKAKNRRIRYFEQSNHMGSTLLINSALLALKERQTGLVNVVIVYNPNISWSSEEHILKKQKQKTPTVRRRHQANR